MRTLQILDKINSLFTKKKKKKKKKIDNLKNSSSGLSSYLNSLLQRVSNFANFRRNNIHLQKSALENSVFQQPTAKKR